MASYEPGEASWSQLKKDFGFKRRPDAGDDFNSSMMDKSGTQDVGDGTFQLGDSSGAYMTEKDWEKNRNTDKTWEAYAKVYGEEAMQSKREGNEDGLSASAFDSLMDNLYEGGDDKEDKVELTPEDYKYSQPIMDAKERVSKFQEDRQSGALYDAVTPTDDAKEATKSQMKHKNKAYELELD